MRNGAKTICGIFGSYIHLCEVDREYCGGESLGQPAGGVLAGLGPPVEAAQTLEDDPEAVHVGEHVEPLVPGLLFKARLKALLFVTIRVSRSAGRACGPPDAIPLHPGAVPSVTSAALLLRNVKQRLL